MEILIEFAKLLLPAAAVLYAMYLTVKSFLDREMTQKMVEIKLKNTDTVLPIRLQAYERVCLFLERITPNNLIIRLNQGDFSAREFQHVLLAEIRQEYNHNISQQVYVSNEAWEYVVSAKEGIISTINQAAEAVEDDAKSIDLAKKIFEISMEKETDPTAHALAKIKEEIRHFF